MPEQASNEEPQTETDAPANDPVPGKEAKPASDASGPDNPIASQPVSLKDLAVSNQKTAELQQSLNATYQTVPAVLEIAGLILQKRNEGEQALGEGVKVVENVLQEAIDKADALSASLLKRNELLKTALQDKDQLAKLLQSGAGNGLAPQNGVGKGAAGANLKASLSDPKIAYQLNLLMGNMQSMVSREVENQLAQLRAQAERMMQQGK